LQVHLNSQLATPGFHLLPRASTTEQQRQNFIMATNPADPVLSATSASADPLGLPPAKMLKSMQNIWRCSMAS
jgi:hypothetical protein